VLHPSIEEHSAGWTGTRSNPNSNKTEPSICPATITQSPLLRQDAD
jgi:hypothetical protein